MLTPSQADKIITKHLPKFSSQIIPLANSYGAILDEDIRADRDMPAFDKALMDGIAVSFKVWKKGRCVFLIQGIQSAGQAPKKLKSDQYCFEITTGSVLPKDCDCVVPVEKIVFKGKEARINPEIKLSRFQNVQLQGSDKKKGDAVLKKGLRLFAPQIAVAASVGKNQIKVKERLKVAVIATGDELKNISAKVSPYETRLSNSVFIKTALDATGLFTSTMFHIKDDQKVLHATLKKILAEYSVLVLSGGVSKGKFDFVPGVLKELGVQEKFHRISQKPGGPMWFGVKKQIPVFALPGNPVSTQVCLCRYVIPHLSNALGLKPAIQFVKLLEDVKIATDLTYFLPVQVCQKNDTSVLAKPVYFNRSGNLSALATTDGFVELSGFQRNFRKGTVVRLFRWN